MKRSTIFLIILLAIFLVNFSPVVQAQELQVTLGDETIVPGDSLKFVVSYKTNQPATLLMMLANKVGKTWERRYPLLGDTYEAALALPADMPQGNYTLQFIVLQNFFTFSGKLISPGNVKFLHSTLLTKDGDVYEKEIPILPDNSFSFSNVLFENDAILSFSNKKIEPEELNLSVNNVQDSVMPGVNVVKKNIFIGTEQAAKTLKQNTPFSNFSNPGDAHTLDVVVVEAKMKSDAEKFNDTYSTGLFRSYNERILDLTGANNGYRSVLQFLQGRVAGLNINYSLFGQVVTWRNLPVSFYIDENRSDISIVESIPISDIAIVKAYPPPFFGNFGGSGGAIAIYTKRGGSYKNLGRTTFQVTGYTPLSSALKVFE